MNIWRVKFTCYFHSSSSGSGTYRNPDERKKALIMTEGESLKDVLAAIESAIGPQYVIVKVRRVKWLGTAERTLT